MESAVIGNSEIKEQEQFWRNWISTFSKQNDLKFRGEKRLLALYQQEKQQREYDKLLASVVKSNRSKREDLVVKIAAEKTFVLIEQNEWEEAHKTFEKAMKYLRSKAGGALFYNLVQPYVRSCLDAGKRDYAKEAMNRARKVFEAKPGSILDHDLKQLAKLVSN